MSDILRLVEAIDSDNMENMAGRLVNRVEWQKIKEWIRTVEEDRKVGLGLAVRDDSGLYTVEDGWIETFTGIQFYFGAPTVEMFRFDDIAHSLSNLCRYVGHTKKFYTVAEHSALMAEYVIEKTGDYKLAKSALFHDGAEGYIGDQARPIKAKMTQFQGLEAKIDAKLCEAFDLPYPFPRLIKELDARILRDERDQVMSKSGNKWGTDSLEPLGIKIHFWDPAEAEDNFRFVYDEIKRNLG